MCAALLFGADAVDPETGEVPPETAAAPPTGDLVEVLSGVLRVKDEKIYINKGRNDGITVGVLGDVYELEPITDLDGRVLDVEETLVGKARVVEVRDVLCVAEVVESLKPFDRGFRVKLMAARPPGSAPTASATDTRTLCPSGMVLFPEGEFKFWGPSPTDGSGGPIVELVEHTGAFCVDAIPTKFPMITWVEAMESCTNQGKRLCEKMEIRKSCALGREQARKADAEGLKIEKLQDMDASREWSYEWDDEGATTMKAGSCACQGGRPSCYGCYYENCGASKRKYRCCSDPM